MSKPHGDGGKGSVRRNEDTEAYRNNFDNIFRKTKETPMNDFNDDDPQDLSEDNERSEDEWTCDVCGGPMYRQAHWNYAQCDDCGARQELENDDYN
jgi:rubrerythrin